MNALANAAEIEYAVPIGPDPCADREEIEAHAPDVLKAVIAGIDGLAHGIAIFDAGGHLHYANAEARAVLSRWKEGTSPRSSDSHQRWREALRRVCQRGFRDLFGFSDADALRYVAMIPVLIQGRCFAFVTFDREELCGSIELQMFCRRHGLSPTESLVLRQLCHGLRPSQIAREHGVSDATVMSQIAAVRNKTLFSSVQSLLWALSKMPPLNSVSAYRQ